MTKHGNTSSATTKIKYLFGGLYFFCIVSIAVYAFEKPFYNWDALPYMGVTLSYDHADKKFIHDTVYEIAKNQIPPSTYGLITDTSMNYKRRMLQNENDFYNLLPFYVVKPLYTGMIYLFYKSGVPLLRATVLPSTISYFLIGILLFVWLMRYVQLYFAVLASLLTMLSAPMLEVAKTSSPDCLATFLLLMVFYLLIEKKSLPWTFLFLLLSIFARLDDIIPCFFILSLLAFTNKWKQKLKIKGYILMILTMVIAYFLITSSASKYGWNLLYYPSFAKHLNISYEASANFSFKDYFILFYTHFISAFFFTHFILFILLALILFIDKFQLKYRQLTFDQSLIIVIFLSIVLRFILQPLIADRFFVVYYLLIIILLIKKYSEFTFYKNSMS